jgi:hypothetical protein
MSDLVAEITELAELLFRQVHPSWIEDGIPTLLAFNPTTKDDGQLSVARGAKTTAAAAFTRHTETLNLRSAGTWAVAVGEARDGGVVARDDSHLPDVEDPAHAFVDFRGKTKRERSVAATVLRARASARGVLFSPPPQ